MDCLIKPAFFLFCFLVFASVPLPAATGDMAIRVQQHTAVYQVTRNNNPVAKVTLDLSRQGDSWTYRGFTHDMQGFAKVLNVKGEQRVTGQWHEGTFQPDDYRFTFSLVGYRSRWGAEFDWPAGTVTAGKKSRKTKLSLAGGAMDPMSLFLNTGSYLVTGQSDIQVDVIDEDEIENHLYVAEAEESLDTALGCLETTRIKRIRKNAKRTSLAWYANNLAYIPVMLQHKKQKGNDLTVRIISLEIDGRPVTPTASCPADQKLAASG